MLADQATGWQCRGLRAEINSFQRSRHDRNAYAQTRIKSCRSGQWSEDHFVSSVLWLFTLWRSPFKREVRLKDSSSSR